MASPHQGSLASNRSAFNFTQEGLIVGAHEASLAMLHNGMESHPTILDGSHAQHAVPEPPKTLTICHMTAARNMLCAQECAHLWLVHMHAYTPIQTCV